MRPRWVAGAVGLGSLVARAAMASEEAHGHDGGIPVGTLIFSTVNLLIFGWILARFALPQIRGWVQQRRVRIVSALQEAAAARQEALQLRAQWEARLADFDRAVEEMRQQARADAERERDRVLAAAHRTAEAIRRDAERTAAHELRRMQEQVRAELVRQAVRLAETAVRTAWTPADQHRFVAEFLKQVQR